MKIHEIDWKDKNTKYRYNDLLWKSNGVDLVCCDTKELIYLSDSENLKNILQADFEPVVDWSKVEVDTPVIISGNLKRHFAGVENGSIMVWSNGQTSWTTLTKTGYNPSQVRLAEVE